MVNCNAPGRITALMIYINFANEHTKLVEFDFNAKSVLFTRTRPARFHQDFFRLFDVGYIVGGSQKMSEIGVEMLDYFRENVRIFRKLSKTLAKVKMFFAQDLRAKTQQSCPSQTSPRLFSNVRKMLNVEENVGNSRKMSDIVRSLNSEGETFYYLSFVSFN